MPILLKHSKSAKYYLIEKITKIYCLKLLGFNIIYSIINWKLIKNYKNKFYNNIINENN